jgi:hypothetical protein
MSNTPKYNFQTLRFYKDELRIVCTDANKYLYEDIKLRSAAYIYAKRKSFATGLDFRLKVSRVQGGWIVKIKK